MGYGVWPKPLPHPPPQVNALHGDPLDGEGAILQVKELAQDLQRDIHTQFVAPAGAAGGPAVEVGHSLSCTAGLHSLSSPSTTLCITQSCIM